MDQGGNGDGEFKKEVRGLSTQRSEGHKGVGVINVSGVGDIEVRGVGDPLRESDQEREKEIAHHSREGGWEGGRVGGRAGRDGERVR